MGLAPTHVEMIRGTARQLLAAEAKVTLFGSCVPDHLKGSDADLSVEMPDAVDEPVLLSDRMAARVSRAMGGRRVDVVLEAPDLEAPPVHQIAQLTGGSL